MLEQLEVRHSDERGRGLFACAPLPADSLVLRALPAAVVADDAEARRRCCVCLARTDRPPCARCGAAVLCKRCAENSGARMLHDDECAALRLLRDAPAADRPAGETRSLRLLMRTQLWRWRATRRPEDEQYTTEWWGAGDALGDELDDVDDLAAPPDDSAVWPNLFATAQQARYFLPAETRRAHEAVAQLVGGLLCNTLALYAEEGGRRREIGVALSCQAALLNHDCAGYNCDWQVDADGCVVVRTTRAVRRGEELLLSYVDPALPGAERRKRLRASFFFECKCAACRRDVG